MASSTRPSKSLVSAAAAAALVPMTRAGRQRGVAFVWTTGRKFRERWVTIVLVMCLHSFMRKARLKSANFRWAYCATAPSIIGPCRFRAGEARETRADRPPAAWNWFPLPENVRPEKREERAG